jgi:hypothetical protein
MRKSMILAAMLLIAAGHLPEFLYHDVRESTS